MANEVYLQRRLILAETSLRNLMAIVMEQSPPNTQALISRMGFDWDQQLDQMDCEHCLIQKGSSGVAADDAAGKSASNETSFQSLEVDQYLAVLSGIRRRRLAAVIEVKTNGNMAKFAELTGYSRAAIHQFLSPAYGGGRSIGELAARTLEHKAGLPFGWLDQKQ